MGTECASSAPRPSFLLWLLGIGSQSCMMNMYFHRPCLGGTGTVSLADRAFHPAAWSTLLVNTAWPYSRFGPSASPGVMGMLRCLCWHAQRCSVYVMWHHRCGQTLHLLLFMPPGPGCPFRCSSWCCKQLYRAER